MRLKISVLAFLIIGSMGVVDVSAKWFNLTPKNNSIYPGQYREMHDKVSVRVHEMSSRECKREFGRKFKNRKSPASIIPLRVAITNYSNKAVTFSKGSAGLQQVPNRVLSKKFFIPSYLPFCVGCYVSGALLPFGLLFGLVGGLLLISGNVLGAMIAEAIAFSVIAVPYHAGKAAQNGIEAKKDEQRELWSIIGEESYKVMPGTQKTVFIFVRKKNYKSTFNLFVKKTNKAKTRISFDVTLGSNV